MLSDELSLLILYGLLVALTVILQATGVMTQLGTGYALSARDEAVTAEGMGGRLDRARRNSVTALALVTVPILILALQDRFSENSLLAAQVFLAARVVYLPAYAFGITGVRTLAWAAGFFATIGLYFVAL